MSIYLNTHSIIMSAATADFTGYTYCEVYAGVAATPVINGIAVSMAAGSSLQVKVRSISGTLTGVYLLGEPINVSYDNPILG